MLIWVIKNGASTVYGPCFWDAIAFSGVLRGFGYSVSFPPAEPESAIVIGDISVEPTQDPIPDPTDYMALMRSHRDDLINNIYWRVERYQSQDAGGITPTDDDTKMAEIYVYLQSLRDMPETYPDIDTKEKYDALVWPTVPI